jgi:hypothetical protein
MRSKKEGLEGFSEVLHANKIFTSRAFPHVETALAGGVLG